MKSGGLFRFVEQKTFAFGDTLSFDMPRGFDLDTILVEVTGSLTITTAPTQYHANSAARLIDRLELFSDGSTKLTEASGIMKSLGLFERGMKRSITNPGGAATGTVPVKAYYVLDRINADGLRPKDSSLHTQSPFMSKLTMEVKTTSSINDLVHTAGSFNGALNSITVKVYVAQTREFTQAGLAEGRMVKNESLIVETIDSTTTNHRVKLATGMMLRGCQIYALDDSGALDNTIINNIQIKSGSDVPFSFDGATVETINKLSYDISDNQWLDGFYFADLTPMGNLNKLYDARGASELDLILDVTKPSGGDGTVVIVPQQFIQQAPLQQ